jgi:hypothetical protein
LFKKDDDFLPFERDKGTFKIIHPPHKS